MAASSQLSPYKDTEVTKDGAIIHPRFQKWLDILWDHIVHQHRPIDLTNTNEDFRLRVGEIAKINITGASTPLNIEVGDGHYLLDIAFDQSTFAADQDIYLNINNTTYTGEFKAVFIRANTAINPLQVDVVDTDTDCHFLASAMSPYRISMSLRIFGNMSEVSGDVHGQVSGNREYHSMHSVRVATPLHTSLGTLEIGEAATGLVYVRRLA